MLPPWLTGLADAARQRLAMDALPHALLIAGPPGWGEAELAAWLALTIVQARTDRDASALAHPDLRWIEPEGRQIKVDAVREVVAFAQGTPQIAPRKAVVVAAAHCFNQSSANALLKTLEEPPPGTHLLLATSYPGRLLPTIRSRCQALTIRPDASAARAWLTEHVAADGLDGYLFEHGGAPLAVREAVERGDVLLGELLQQALRTEPGAELLAILLDSGLTDALGRWSRYLLAEAGGQRRLPALAAVSRRALFAFADELTWTRRVLLTATSPNERMLAERIIARWCQLGQPAAA